MASIFFYYTLILVWYVMLQFPTSSGTKTSNLTGFSTYLIHRDSIESPFYNSSLSQSDLVERAILRSSSRFSHLKSLLKLPNNGTKDIFTIEAPIISARGEYLMKFSVGTPSVKQWATLDTASDIVWTQCLECINCYEQTQPKFDPRRSSSYRPIPCETSTCLQLGTYMNCRGVHRNCKYHIQYLDDSFSKGELARETFKLGMLYVKNMVYGCSNNNVGHYKEYSAGIVAIGNGPLSLVHQLPSGMGRRFSYCLTDPYQDSRSMISFGTDAILSSHGSMSTPLVLTQVPARHFYFITLEGISIDNMRFAISVHILLDTGTLLTYLQEDVYQRLEYNIKREIEDTPIPQPRDSEYKLCYTNSPNFYFPTIKFHFSEGAYLVLSMRNTLLTKGGLLCLSIVPARDNLSMLGNMLQLETMIGYDIDNEIVSFTPDYC